MSIIVRTLLVFTVLMLNVQLSAAQEKVRVGWAAMTASHTPLWVAQDEVCSPSRDWSRS